MVKGLGDSITYYSPDRDTWKKFHEIYPDHKCEISKYAYDDKSWKPKAIHTETINMSSTKKCICSDSQEGEDKHYTGKF